jgi:hypothetical protein
MICDSDEDAAGEVERHDDERRDSVALDEFSGPVHCAVEVRFALNRVAFTARAFRVQCARVHVGVDRHLLARHRVEREARSHFGDALRSAGDYYELNRDQDRKDDQAYD